LKKEHEGARYRAFLFTKAAIPGSAAIDAKRRERSRPGLDGDPRKHASLPLHVLHCREFRSGPRYSHRPRSVRDEVRRVIDAFLAWHRDMSSILATALLQKTPIDSVAALVDEVRAYSGSLRRKPRWRLTYAQKKPPHGLPYTP